MKNFPKKNNQIIFTKKIVSEGVFHIFVVLRQQATRIFKLRFWGKFNIVFSNTSYFPLKNAFLTFLIDYLDTSLDALTRFRLESV